MSSRRDSLQMERAIAHLLRARTALDEAAHALDAISEEAGDRLALASDVAGAQARLAEALAAAIQAAPHASLDNLLAALTGDSRRDARPGNH
jgi:FAD/FMN-containing dehydrogenase